MKDDLIVGHVTPADGNIFLDLGFDPEEAARLKADSDREIMQRQSKRSCAGT